MGIMELRQAQFQEKQKMKEICEAIDINGNGHITWEEFQKKVAEPRIARHFTSLGMNMKKAEIFFHVLVDSVGHNDVPCKSFVEGCLYLKGAASSMDLHILSEQLKLFEQQ